MHSVCGYQWHRPSNSFISRQSACCLVCLCIKSPHTHSNPVCSDRERITGHCVWLWRQITSLLRLFSRNPFIKVPCDCRKSLWNSWATTLTSNTRKTKSFSLQTTLSRAYLPEAGNELDDLEIAAVLPMSEEKLSIYNWKQQMMQFFRTWNQLFWMAGQSIKAKYQMIFVHIWILRNWFPSITFRSWSMQETGKRNSFLAWFSSRHSSCSQQMFCVQHVWRATNPKSYVSRTLFLTGLGKWWVQIWIRVSDLPYDSWLLLRILRVRLSALS